MNRYTQKGIGLVEVVVASAIVTLVTVGMLSTYSVLARFGRTRSIEAQAHTVLEEGVEITRLLRDMSWSTVSTYTLDTPYYFLFDAGVWEATTTQVMIDNRFERTVQFSSVYRDTNGSIAPSGTIDTDTRRAQVSVAYLNGTGTTTKTIDLFISNVFE